MKKIIMIIAFICVVSSAVMADDREDRLECFVIDNKEVCLSHDEIITLTIDLLKVLQQK